MEKNFGEINVLHEEIQKMIEMFEERVKSQCLSRQEKSLLKFKDQLMDSQGEYRLLQNERSNQSIERGVLTFKTNQEKRYKQQTDHAQQTLKLYEDLKTQLHKGEEYQRELTLQTEFLDRQCKIARQKAAVLEKELLSLKQNCSIKPQSSQAVLKQTFQSNTKQIRKQEKAKTRMQTLEDFVEFALLPQNFIEEALEQLEWSTLTRPREKLGLIQKVLSLQSVKKYLYLLIFHT